MNLFKKKRAPVVTEFVCTEDGCGFACDDDKSLQRHIEWKHSKADNTDEKVLDKQA